MEKDDVQLIHAVLSGDDEAFGTLVKKYQKSVHALAWRKIGDFHYAEEITQDTFIQAYKKLSTLKDCNQFAGWLYVITNNLCTDWLRKKKPAIQPMGDSSVKEIEKQTYERYLLEKREKEVSEHRHEIVQLLLEELPESERTVVTLYYLGEMTTKEIGKFMGVSVNTITSRLQRARERLKASGEQLINETLGGWQLPNNIYENIMKQISDINPIPSPTGKPFLPWVAYSAAAVIVILLVSVSNQFLARFQEPYSLEAQSEPTIEIVDSLVVLETDAKPSMRNQIGQDVTTGKTSSTGSDLSEKISAPNTSENTLKLPFAYSDPKVSRFTLSNGIRVVNLHVENAKDVGIFSYLPLGFVGDAKAKTQWSNLIMHLSIRSTGPIDYRTSNAETMTDNMRFDFIGNTDTWTHGLKLHAKWLSGLPFTAESLAEARPNALAQIEFVEKNLATHKYADAAWHQVVQHGINDIAIRGNIQSAQLSDLQEYRDQNLVQKDGVLLCVIGGVDPDTLKESMEEGLGAISLTEKKLPHKIGSTEITRDQNATWDLKVTHYMEAYPMPSPEDKDYPSLYITSLLLQGSLLQDAKLKEMVGNIFCSVDLGTPEQGYLYVSASLKPDTDIMEVKERIGQLIKKLKESYNQLQIYMIAKSISKELSAPPDLNTLMQNKPENVSETYALLQVGVSWGMMEYKYGESLAQLASAFADVTSADVSSAVNRYLTTDQRRTLVLTPRASE